ncbi:ciliary microtubule inner protein 7-like [Babylonia areolata]|uniref:ciliary microtubule inner protein 7-like n=1 Tax=Babylonia areolata TaxID=304850 RepID=UPI003FD1003B
MPAPSATEMTVGSWFPTGYHGHYRSKPRADFLCEYRQLARPEPPDKFIARSLSNRHSFTKHDNRETFLNDAIIFGKGLGRKRSEKYAPVFNQDFYTWLPLQKEIRASLPNLSTYQTTFTPRCCLPVPQPIVRSRLTEQSHEADQNGTTIYHSEFGVNCPHSRQVWQRAHPALALSTTNRENSARRNPHQPRESVASCLNWHHPRKTSQPQAADTSGLHLPHVPASPRSDPQLPV